jgi:hypothetical protein
MQPRRVTASAFQSSFGALSDKARVEPVVITKHGRERRDRRVGLTTEFPEEWVEAVRKPEAPDEFAHLDAELK